MNNLFYWLLILLLVFMLLFLVANYLVKRTHWYTNRFAYTSQFAKSKKNELEIVNLGSNPARFAFFYQEVFGENWSTGTQDPVMDYELLVNHHHKLKEGAVVLLPIVLFSSITPYAMRYKSGYFDNEYYSKFSKLLNAQQVLALPNIAMIRAKLLFPLLFNPRAVLYILFDVDKEDRHLKTNQPLQAIELEKDAKQWINGWKKEFDLIDLEAPLNKRLLESQEECAQQYLRTIDFCLEHNYKPVLIFPPISKYLLSLVSDKVQDIYVYSFIERIKRERNIQFLDYMSDNRFKSPSLYFDSFFMNLNGRKYFTKCVLSDLHVEPVRKQTNFTNQDV